MKKKPSERTAANDDDLEIPELPASFFKKAVRGKYYARMTAKSNVVRIASDLVSAFPNESSVNHALRELLKFRETLASITADKVRRKKTA
jgi:hypothetical protein